MWKFGPEVVIDVETRSECDLKRAGGYEYSRHPSTEIICFGYQIDNGPRKIFYPFWGERMPDDLVRALCTPGVRLIAHNAFFEQMLLAHCFISKYLNLASSAAIDTIRKLFAFNPKNWTCTAAKCRAHALPGALEKACLAAKLPIEKDKVGHKLMLKLCKPRKTWLLKGTGDKYSGTHAEFIRLGDYCLIDVGAEKMLHNYIPDLSPYEQRVWELDQKMNYQGVKADVDACKLILGMIEKEALVLKTEVDSLTMGIVESAAQRAEVLDFVRSEGLELPNLQAKTVKDALAKGGMSEVAKRLLEIRQVVSKTSTAKYKRFIERAGSDVRVRDLLVYHGPTTGRWAGGGGVQPQNFPRGLIEDTDQAIDVILSGDIELIRMIYADPMMTFSSCLRGMITATPGKLLFGADYNAIETRVLWALAGHSRGLKLFTDGVDSYKDMASAIFKKPISEISKNERQLGKKAVLGCGYGMGHKKFMTTCHAEGMNDVDTKLAKTAVDAYRDLHSPVKDLWSLLERAAVFAVHNPTKKVNVKGVTWFMSDLGDFLYCKLPSGRLLSYPYPSIKVEPTPWGEPKPVLYYWGLNSFNRKWMEEKTYGGKLTENLCQAIARDIMVHGMFNVEAAGYNLLITVHDELIAEAEVGDVKEFEQLITDLPEWAKGYPITAEGFQSFRYKK